MIQNIMRDSQEYRPRLVLLAVVPGIWLCLCFRALAAARRVFANRKLRLLLALSALGALVSFCPQALAREEKEERRRNQAAADTLFTNGIIHVLKLSIPQEGLRSLRRDPRTYVKGTFQDGPSRFTNVLVRLKGGAGSFRGVDDKPGFTLHLKEAGSAFHGLEKFHLNNSVQDSTYLSEWVCGELFRSAGVPVARVAHAVVELNGRRLGLYTLLREHQLRFPGALFQEDPWQLVQSG